MRGRRSAGVGGAAVWLALVCLPLVGCTVVVKQAAPATTTTVAPAPTAANAVVVAEQSWHTSHLSWYIEFADDSAQVKRLIHTTDKTLFDVCRDLETAFRAAGASPPNPVLAMNTEWTAAILAYGNAGGNCDEISAVDDNQIPRFVTRSLNYLYSADAHMGALKALEAKQNG